MNFLLETLRLGFTNLLLHKLRSLLTALGIVFGVAAVIAMVAIGEGNKRKALEDIEKLGAKNIIVRSRKPDDSAQSKQASSSRQRTINYGLTYADERRIMQVAQGSGVVDLIVPLKLVGTKVGGKYKQIPAMAFGTTPQLIEVTSLRIDRGRYLTATDEARQERVAVIGAELAKQLFPLEDPLEGHIIVYNGPGNCSFRVVGILKPVGLAGGAGSALVGRDLNFDVHVPKSTAIDQFGDRVVTIKTGSFESMVVQLEEIYIQAREQDDVRALAAQIERMVQLEHGEKGDVTVIVPLELIEQTERTGRMFTVFLISIAAISLLVGGMGIMNIMLASVTERTREIGIRRALGATRSHIVAQFLVETATLSAVGGAVGVIVGIGGAALYGSLLLQPGMGEPYVAGWSIIVGLAVAVTTGIGFGLYPAYRASMQDPIVALRHD
ncbi:MAG: ABC transporter permease [Phycisphaeraceae bacterium]